MAYVSFGEVRNEISRHEKNRWAISLGAVACTQRLNPQLHGYFLSSVVEEDSHRFAICKDILRRMWVCVDARSAADFLQSEEQKKFEDSLLSEDEAFSAGHPYAVDAMESLAISARYLTSGDIREAFAIFEQSYNVVDNFVVNSFKLPTTTREDEALVISQPLVQRELQRQLRDLRQACAAPFDQFSKVCFELRRRAEEEGAMFFSE